MKRVCWFYGKVIEHIHPYLVITKIHFFDDNNAFKGIFHDLSMVESKFPCSCYSNISFDIYNLIKDISIELKGGLNK